MAESELIVHIEQALWPKGVVRSLSGLLRSLGDKHGNLVIVAQPTKGHILVKGPADKIEEAKPGLRAIIEEQFPDADCPEELQPAEVAAPAAPAAPAPAAAPAAPAPAPVPPAPAPAKAREVAPVQVVIEGHCHARRLRAPFYGTSPDLLWQCVRKSSCFQRPGGVNKKRFSAEPGNLLGLHCQQYSGLAGDRALDVRPKQVGQKRSIELVQSVAKAQLRRRPGSFLVASGLEKCKKKGLRRLDKELLGMSYRPGAHKLARLKYIKIHLSFKKPKPRIQKHK
ncbi:unnamed protein product [Effrenium voratum]|uniref:Ribosomal eL28/Mak16 domain-containing protein n=1 Tax=Effrenium voratum TaxID=2562239 RepID=A0AA36JES0_9DINO|nr:unnamed protein product [Effrenium voratum]